MASEFEVAEHHEPEASTGHEAVAGEGGDHLPAEGELIEELGHYEDGAHDAPFPPFDPDYFVPQLVWLVITFGVLYVLMSRMALPRVAGIIEGRRERVAGDLGKAADLNEQADQAQSEYEQALADARTKAHTIANETRDKMKAEADELRADSDAKLEDQLAAAETRIADTKTKAMANVRDVATEAALTIVNQLTGETADAPSVVGAVDKAMAGGRS
jgi:F-type H+-transporting ATPase subunit b